MTDYKESRPDDFSQKPLDDDLEAFLPSNGQSSDCCNLDDLICDLPKQEEITYQSEASFTDVEQNYKIEKDRQELKELEEKNKNTESARSMRESYATKTFWMVSICLFFWGFMVFWLACWNVYNGKPPLSEKEFITLTAGITANIFAAFLGVIKGIFKLSFDELRHKENDKGDH